MSSSNTLLNGKKALIIGGSSGAFETRYLLLVLFNLICSINTGIGRAVAAASLAHGTSVVIASSTQSKVDDAVELLRKGIQPNSNVTLSGQSVNITDFATLTTFLSKEAPFDHLVSG